MPWKIPTRSKYHLSLKEINKGSKITEGLWYLQWNSSYTFFSGPGNKAYNSINVILKLLLKIYQENLPFIFKTERHKFPEMLQSKKQMYIIKAHVKFFFFYHKSFIKIIYYTYIVLKRNHWNRFSCK